MGQSHPDSLSGRRVAVMGLGRFGGGVGVTRWLVGQGAEVVVTDAASAESLAESVAALADLPVAFALGGHDEGVLDGCELLVVNPAVPDAAALLQAARRRGLELTSEINLFIERCPARIVGITGSVGKSTTTAMTAAVLATAHCTHMGGNIGVSLLERLDGGIAPEDLVVLELSSFQLERLAWLGISPTVALATNLRPNHLDRHGDMAGYAAAKKNIFKFQKPGDLLLLPAGDAELAGWAAEAPARCEFYDVTLPPECVLKIPGVHNRVNAAAAWAIGRQFDVDGDAAAAALAAFPGLPHRLAFVAERGGVRCFNDSKATTPDGVAVALESFEREGIVAIVGGYDKKIDLAPLAVLLARRCRAVIATGAVGPVLAELVKGAAQSENPAGCKAEYYADFDAAVARALAVARPGEVVLLSPGCASYGQFINYEQRGARFEHLVNNASL